jgi:hypothetical protein
MVAFGNAIPNKAEIVGAISGITVLSKVEPLLMP